MEQPWVWPSYGLVGRTEAALRGLVGLRFVVTRVGTMSGVVARMVGGAPGHLPF